MSNSVSGPLSSLTFLATATMVPQIIGVIALPVITNVYSVEAYGLFASFFAVLTTLVNISSFRLINAVYVCKSYEEVYIKALARRLIFANSLVLLIVVGGLLLLGLIPNFFLLLPIAFVTSSIVNNIYIEVGVRRAYRRLAQLRMLESLVLNSSKILSSFAGVVGLVGSIFLANGVVSLIKKTAHREKSDSSRLRGEGNRKQYHVLKKYQSFVAFQFPSQCLSLIVQFFPIFYFMSFSTAESLGLLSLAITITNIPINAIGQSISQYVISENGRSSDLRSLFRVLIFIIGILCVVAIPIFYYLNNIALFIINEFFDEKWGGSVNYIIAFSYLGFMKVITMVVINICNIIKYQKFQLLLNLTLFLTAVGSALLAVSEREFVNLFVIGNCLVLALAIFHLMLLLSRIKNEKNYVRW